MAKLPEKPYKFPVDTDVIAYSNAAGKIFQCTMADLKSYASGGTGGGGTTLSAPVLSASVISSTQIDPSWTNVANESSYELQRRLSPSGSWATVATPAVNVVSFNNTGLSPSTAYDYRVRAVGDGVTYLTSAWSNVVTATTSAGGSSYDTDAQAAITFIEAQGYTMTVTEKDGFNAFFLGLKSGTLWAKRKAFYTLLGTSLAHAKCNIFNPADTNAAYRLTQTGTITFANGATCTSGGNSDGLYMGDLNETTLGQDSNCLYVGVSTNVAELKAAIGTNNAFANPHYILPRTGSDETWMANYCSVNTVSGSTSSIGRWYNNRNGASVWKNYKNGSVISSPNTTSGATGGGGSLPIIICNGGNGALGAYTGKVITAGAFAGLSDAEVAELDGYISSLHTALGK